VTAKASAVLAPANLRAWAISKQISEQSSFGTVMMPFAVLSRNFLLLGRRAHLSAKEDKNKQGKLF